MKTFALRALETSDEMQKLLGFNVDSLRFIKMQAAKMNPETINKTRTFGENCGSLTVKTKGTCGTVRIIRFLMNQWILQFCGKSVLRNQNTQWGASRWKQRRSCGQVRDWNSQKEGTNGMFWEFWPIGNVTQRNRPKFSSRMNARPQTVANRRRL